MVDFGRRLDEAEKNFSKDVLKIRPKATSGIRSPSRDFDFRGTGSGDGPGNFEVIFDVTESRRETHSSKVSKHPREDGLEFSENVQKKPVVFNITAKVSAHPIEESKMRSEPGNRHERAWQELVSIINNSEEIIYITKRRTYRQMSISRLQRVEDAPGSQDLEFSAKLEYRPKVSFRRESVPKDVIDSIIRDQAQSDNNKGEQPTETPTGGELGSVEKLVDGESGTALKTFFFGGSPDEQKRVKETQEQESNLNFTPQTFTPGP